MAHTTENKKPLLNRVRRIQGQLKSLELALEEGSECSAVLQQIAAVRGGINGLMMEVIEGHLRTHLVPADGGHADELDDLIKIFRSYMK
ncbi:metal/formaldehyde-sensitive transcriptional repressor [Panacagrimonas sp.]|uniref:metal/formaldehyde-sensitive transcriptional repressor n=1 Tax=Panacagrimonas sp. TaxID=2480088 RepID=UPI003B51AABE